MSFRFLAVCILCEVFRPQCGLPALAGALARGAADGGAEGIEGRAPAEAALPLKPVELAPENPDEAPPRLNPAFVPIGARALI